MENGLFSLFLIFQVIKPFGRNTLQKYTFTMAEKQSGIKNNKKDVGPSRIAFVERNKWKKVFHLYLWGKFSSVKNDKKFFQ